MQPWKPLCAYTNMFIQHSGMLQPEKRHCACHVHVHYWMYACAYMFIYIYIYICMYVCMYVCIYIYVYIIHTYIHTVLRYDTTCTNEHATWKTCEAYKLWSYRHWIQTFAQCHEAWPRSQKLSSCKRAWNYKVINTAMCTIMPQQRCWVTIASQGSSLRQCCQTDNPVSCVEVSIQSTVIQWAILRLAKSIMAIAPTEFQYE